MCVNQRNTQKGSVQIKIELWNPPLKDLEVDQEKVGHHLHQVKLALHQPTLVLQPCLLEHEEVVRFIRGGRVSKGRIRNSGLNVPIGFAVFIVHDGTCMTNIIFYLIFVLLNIYL